jgi:hypothetical protein
MIKCSVKLLTSIVTTLISVARLFSCACMCWVTREHCRCLQNDVPDWGKCLSSSCCTSNAHLSLVMDEIPSFCVVCLPCRYPSDSKSMPRLGRQKKDSVDQTSAVVCGLDTRSFLLSDQFHLFNFVTCLHRAMFALSFLCALARDAHNFSMVVLHSLNASHSFIPTSFVFCTTI